MLNCVLDLSCIKLLYPNPVTFCLVTFDPDVGNHTTQFFGGNFNDVSSFDIYRDENVIYWSDDAGEAVKRYQKVDSREVRKHLFLLKTNSLRF